MANGVAALRVALEPAPASTPARATAAKPAAIPAATEIETTIGLAMAAAVTGLGFALAEYQNGGLRPETRTVNGERIAALYWLQQAHGGELDFPAVARAAGKAALRTYFDADFYRTHGPGGGDVVLDTYIDDVLVVLSKVTAFERAWAN